MKLEGNRLLFKLGGEFFCIDTHAVTRIIEDGKIFRLPLAPPKIAAVINLKGELIPVIDPAYILNIPLSLEPIIEKASILILGRPPKLIGFPLSEKEKVSFICKEGVSDIPLRKVKERYIKGVITYKDNDAKILDWEQILQDIYE